MRLESQQTYLEPPCLDWCQDGISVQAIDLRARLEGRRVNGITRTAKYVFFISAGVASGFTPNTWYGFLEAPAHGVVACKERCNIQKKK